MTAEFPPLPWQRHRTLLRLLSLGYFLLGILSASMLFPAAMFVLAMLFGPILRAEFQARPLATLLWMWVALTAFVGLATFATAAFLTSRFLVSHRNRRFCQITAAATLCLATVPGLILGAATLVLLSRPSSKFQFSAPIQPAPRRRVGLDFSRLRQLRAQLSGAHLLWLTIGLILGAILARLSQHPITAVILAVAAILRTASLIRVADARKHRWATASAFVLWFVLAGYLVVWQQLRME